MIASLQPYPEYRQAGLPWLDSVPKHWEMIPNRALMQEQRRIVGENAKDHTLLSLTLRGVIARDMVNPKGKFPAQFNTYKVVEPGDFVFCLFDIDETPRGVGLSPLKGIITGAYDVFRPSPITDPRFLYYYYLFVDDGKLMKPFYTGLRKTIQRGVFASLKAPCPPPEEQAAMVRFLDYANGRLERAIRAKRKVIALLHEQKQAIIHRAVTHGLDPTVPLKPSGTPWLGDIPKHWDLSRVKNEFRCLNTQRIPLNSVERGQMSSRLYDYYGASGVIDKVDDYLFDDELLLIAEDGANLVLRNLPLAIIACGKFWVNNHAHILKPTRGNIVYLANLLETVNYMPWISGAAQPKLTQDRLLSISIAVAPPKEQDAIVEATTKETQPLVTAIGRLEREISLLREYRTRLVADVVTGKLDVRGVTLPAESEPTAALAAETIEQDSSEPEAPENPSD